MALADILETLMLICFSTSWYWSIRKVWREQDSRSINRLFPALVAAGCLLGLGSKLAEFHATGVLAFPVFLYAWNVILSLAQLWLVVQLADQVDGHRVSGVADDRPEPALRRLA